MCPPRRPKPPEPPKPIATAPAPEKRAKKVVIGGKKKKPGAGFSTRIKLKTTGAGTRGDLSLGSDMKKNLNV